jgi:antitoxin HicB
MDYPVRLERDDNNTILVSFPDFPEAHTFGETEADALERARDALATVVDAYIKDRRAIPLPSAIVAAHRVSMPTLMEAKVSLYQAMQRAKVTKSELARRLNVHMPQVDRLLDVQHGSRLDQIEAALTAFGKRLVVGVEDLALVAAAPRQPTMKATARIGARPAAKKAAVRRRRR